MLAIGLLVALLPFRPQPVTAASGSASLPSRFADYSYLTGDVRTSPPGRAIALYQHGWGVEFLDFPQAVLAGADGDVSRRVGLAEQRAGSETQGDPAPMLLSPDGTTIAVGDYVADDPDVAVLDLATGRARTLEVPGGRSTIPLAWSPDSALLAYLSTAQPVDPYSGTAVSGTVGLLDRATGTATLLPGAPDARAVAFSPDGTQLAVHRITPDDGSLSGLDGTPRLGGGVVEITALDGVVDRSLPLASGAHLVGPSAWSPDGALLAVGVRSTSCSELDGSRSEGEWDQLAWDRCWAEQDALAFIDASGDGAPTPSPLSAGQVGYQGLLGWWGSEEVLVLDDVPEPGTPEEDSELYWLTAVPVDGGEARRLSAVAGGGNYGIGSFHLATALLPDIEVRTSGGVDRGPGPLWARVGAAIAAAWVTLLVARAIDRKSRRAS